MFFKAGNCGKSLICNRLPMHFKDGLGCAMPSGSNPLLTLPLGYEALVIARQGVGKLIETLR
jgi:hypothetical protein